MKLILEVKAGAYLHEYGELEPGIAELVDLAAGARMRAQAPYSGYFVGAAVRSAAGIVHAGCNVERCSYSQTTHAEQNAIDTMVATEGPGKIAAIAIIGAHKDDLIAYRSARRAKKAEFSSPCGHCLQIIWENCCGDRDTPIYLALADGGVVGMTIGAALPFPFGPDALGIDYRRPR